MITPIKLTIAFARKFSIQRSEGFSLLESLEKSFNIFKLPDLWEIGPWDTAHLWFLNYLFFMSLFAYLLKSISYKYA